MKIIAIISMLLGLKAAEINVSGKLLRFTLPEDTTLWAGSVMNLVLDVLPDDRDTQNKFQELVDWSCDERVDLKITDFHHYEETIRLLLDRLIAMTTSRARVAYIEFELTRSKQYVSLK
ncbi:MAG: hypothetical protein KF820_00190 [Candidatus Paracaedibacteraceae bacterium]|nr:hypothetical protein [Candidatus Paracaedibacteraceae bacterium]